VDKVTICESSEKYVRDMIEDIPVRYVKPGIYGDFPFENESFALIVCFGVLHHIPNVSKVLKEFYRCLTGGILSSAIQSQQWVIGRSTGPD